MLPIQESAEILEVVPFIMSQIRNEMRGLAEPELSVTQFRVLARLFRHPQSNTTLADWIGISTPSMTRTIDVLVKHDWVTREEPKGHDRREILLVLTSKGKRKYETIKETARAKFAQKLQRLSETKRTELMNGLKILKETFSE